MKQVKFKNKKLHNRWKRHRHIRHKIEGSEGRPRLVVFKSLKHIYVQAINDMTGQTLCAASTLTPSVREEIKKAKGNKDKPFTKTSAAELVGKLVASQLKEKGVEKVAFDRGGFKYHGRVKALADAARKEGINF